MRCVRRVRSGVKAGVNGPVDLNVCLFVYKTHAPDPSGLRGPLHPAHPRPIPDYPALTVRGRHLHSYRSQVGLSDSPMTRGFRGFLAKDFQS